MGDDGMEKKGRLGERYFPGDKYDSNFKIKINSALFFAKHIRRRAENMWKHHIFADIAYSNREIIENLRGLDHNFIM